MPQSALPEGQHVVDAVAGHGHGVARFFQRLDQFFLLSGVTRPKTIQSLAARVKSASDFKVEASTYRSAPSIPARRATSKRSPGCLRR